MAAQLDSARRLADYATAFDFLTKLSIGRTETGVVEAVFDLFTQIFAPATMMYLSVQSGRTADVISRTTVPFDAESAKSSMLQVCAEHARTPSGAGFDLVIGHGPTRAIFRVETVAFVEHMDHYVNLALNIAPVLSLALTNARRYQELQEEQARQRFLAEAGAVLGSTLDVKETLASLARLVVARLADFCIVDLVEEDGVPVRLAVAFSDPSKEHLRRIFERLRLNCPNLARAARETKASVLMRDVTPEYLASVAQSAEHLQALHALDPKSIIVVPVLLHGRLLGTVVFASSLPSHRYGQQDLRLAEDLALRAAFALENARLYEMAQRANRSRDEVLGIVAHDLRNPLGSISMATTLLRRREGPERRNSRPVDTIERAALRMKRLIDDLLDVARIEAGRLSIDRSAIPAQAVVSDAAESQMGLAAGASIELERDVVDELPEVWADRDRLLQVLENLIGNAIKFTAPGGHIVVGARAGAAEVLFWVKDTGKGIALEHQPHLFDRFWQAKTADHLGAGLGLAIVKGIVEAHGGRIWVESTLGSGSTFFFTIPTATSEHDALSEPFTEGPTAGLDRGEPHADVPGS